MTEPPDRRSQAHNAHRLSRLGNKMRIHRQQRRVFNLRVNRYCASR
jgi:hypothetical protein